MRTQSPPAVVRRWSAGGWTDEPDTLAAEEPLQVMLNGEKLSIVMRTPGSDVELAAGLLFAERVISSRDDIATIYVSAEAGETATGVPVKSSLVESNMVDVRLIGEPRRRPKRAFVSSSACGICGAEMIDDMRAELGPVNSKLVFDASELPALVDRVRSAQDVFERTGGLHAAGLFDPSGKLLLVREDVGRHNAVDKVVGRLLLDGGLPASDMILVVSGRAGYEIVQKAVTAGIPMVAAVGAPSSLAVAVAREFGQTLVGFLRKDRFNVYSSPERLS